MSRRRTFPREALRPKGEMRFSIQRMFRASRFLSVIAFTGVAHAGSSTDESFNALLPVTELEAPKVFYAYAKLKDDGATFVPRFPASNSKTLDKPEYYFWGLKITDVEAVKGFLAGRLLRCHIVYDDANLGAADCLAAPEPSEGRTTFSADINDWVSLYEWLPALGWAKQQCNEEIPTHRIHFRPPLGAYACPFRKPDTPYRFIGYPEN